MDKFWKTTDMGFLHVKCPLCGSGQPFDFHHVRDEKFKAVLPREKVLEILTKHGCENQIEEVMKEWNK